MADPAAGVGLLAAVFAGLVSFLSPCVLPLVPGYLSAVTGVPVASLEDAPLRRVVGPSLMFVASFSAIFVLLGMTATRLGTAMREHREILEKVSAAVIIGLGLLLIASLFVVRLNRELRVEGLLRRAGRGGPVVAGAAFAIAWTPCVGPTLGAILSAASLTSTTARAALLLAAYSAGLAIPFLLSAIAFRRMTRAFAVVRRHYPQVIAASALVLVVMGVLVWTGELAELNIQAQRLLDELGVNFFESV